ncbi:hypothetical protein [Methyloglobulus sp.]|uniref:Pepco domain-containing protein n=1 Tax=Methyloglobulus sp. TaxID=2518622 RepID=UPI00398A25BB
MTKHTKHDIDVSIYAPQDASDEKRILSGVSAFVFKTSTESLAKNLSTFMDSLTEVLPSLPASIGDYQVDELQLKLEITGQAGIRLVGSAHGGGTGGLTVILRRARETK